MKTIFVLLALFLPLSCFAKNGQFPYMPTALEWFVVEQNATMAIDRIPSEGWSIKFFEKPPSTIVIHVVYTSGRISSVDEMTKIVKSSTATIARVRKWDWLKIEVKTQDATAPGRGN